jgi:hypothetical protein
VQTHHLGIKPAQIHADRPSRDPELDERAALEAGPPARGGGGVVTSTGLHPVHR